MSVEHAALARRREEPDPKAGAGPRVDLDEPLAGSAYKEPTQRKRLCTTIAIERHLGETGRAAVLGVFADRSSIDTVPRSWPSLPVRCDHVPDGTRYTFGFIPGL